MKSDPFYMGNEYTSERNVLNVINVVGKTFYPDKVFEFKERIEKPTIILEVKFN